MWKVFSNAIVDLMSLVVYCAVHRSDTSWDVDVIEQALIYLCS